MGAYASVCDHDGDEAGSDLGARLLGVLSLMLALSAPPALMSSFRLVMPRHFWTIETMQQTMIVAARSVANWQSVVCRHVIRRRFAPTMLKHPPCGIHVMCT